MNACHFYQEKKKSKITYSVNTYQDILLYIQVD